MCSAGSPLAFGRETEPETEPEPEPEPEMRLCAALAFTSVAAATPEQQQPAPEALAPGLQVAGDARPPPSVGATIAASGGYDDAAASPRRLFVHCERGSDERDGRSLATALASVHRARDQIREWRAAAAVSADRGGGAILVELHGTCHLPTPLTLTAQDAGSSAEEPVVWLGREGAVLSAGRTITQWEAVSWPGAPANTVLRANVSGWPLPITSLRVVQPAAAQPSNAASPWLDEWIPRTRYPKADPKNYSAGWLTTAGWTCPTDFNSGDDATSSNWSIGLEPSVPKELLAEPSNLYFNGYGVGSWSRAGGSGEKDVSAPLALRLLGEASKKRLHRC